MTKQLLDGYFWEKITFQSVYKYAAISILK